LKIGLVSPYDYSSPGGVVNHIANLASYFCQWGHYVRIIAPCVKNRMYSDDLCLKAVGRPLPIPYGGSIARIPLSPWLPVQIRKALKEEKFDILHLHEPFAPLLCVSALAQSNCTNVGTFHACHSKSRTYYVSKPVLKKWYEKLHGKIAVSKAALRFISRYFPGSYRIIPNGIDIERFTPEGLQRNEFTDDKLNIVFVGRLEKRKGLTHLINACALIRKGFTNFRLIVVGPGTRLKPGYEQQVNELNLDNVVFTGFVSNNDLPQYYRTADIFCAPATGGESFGVVLLEAMACGKPVVASNIEGYTNVLEHNEEGLLVPPGDEEALARSLLKLLEDHSLREKMGTKGITKAEKFSWANVTKQVIEYYNSLLH
jgi:phosphatidylinositol alpha-mannosyltransferase